MLPSVMGRWTSLLVQASTSRIHRGSTTLYRAVHFRRWTGGSELSLRCWGSRSLLAKVRLMDRAAQELPLRRWAPRSIHLSLLVAPRRLLLLLTTAEMVGRGRSGPIAGYAAFGPVRRLLILHRASARTDARRRTPSSSRGWSADQQPDFSLTGRGGRQLCKGFILQCIFFWCVFDNHIYKF